MDAYASGADRDVREVAEDLEDLLRLDVDAIKAYNEAIQKIEAQDLRARLSTFRDDHERHVVELTQAIKLMGQQPPAPSTDAKGKLIEGMTALRSAMGDDQAIKAMRQNEDMTNRAYEKASRKAWPADVQTVIERNYSDERHHLQWIEQHLSVAAGSRERT